jgi:negative regulator of flagellin synthesis FlgM
MTVYGGEGNMRIWGEIPRILGINGKQKGLGKVDKASPTVSKKDVISISSEGKDYQTGIKALKALPDIRTAKVNELAEKYNSGSYDVNGRDVADKILKSILDKKA